MDCTAEILSRCGYRCDLCLAYAPNLQAHPEYRLKLSDSWYKYFGFRIAPENIYCEGCLPESPRLIDTACPVKPCVIAKKLQNCAACDAYGCEKLTERLVSYEEILEKFAVIIPENDRESFIRPYENKARLDALRARE